MKVYDRIKDMLCDELEEVSKQKELTSSGLEMIDTAVDVLKDLATIKAMEKEYPDEGYSNDGGYSQGFYPRMPYYMYDAPGMGSSYARGGRGSNTGTSRGRYAYDGTSRRYYDGDYSGDTKEELQRLMHTAQTEKEREAIRDALEHMNR